MSAFVKIKVGKYGGGTIRNMAFPVVKNFGPAGKKGPFITVDGTKYYGEHKPRIRIYTHPDNVDFIEEDEYQNHVAAVVMENAEPNEAIEMEVDEETRIKEIGQRFDILQDMTKAMMQQKIRGMIVSGPPGVGKSFGVEQELEKLNMWTDMGEAARKTEVVKGAMSALGLYAKLHEFKDPGSVVVFDDCDSVLLDDLSLNILKAALDSGRSRKIYWNADSAKLRAESIPNNFEFKGSVCFITNISFEHVRSKKLRDHLDALMSRCHYLDLTLRSNRDKMLRVKEIAQKGVLFSKYDMEDAEEAEVLAFMEDHIPFLREVSLRMALKIADCKVVNGDRWKEFARATCMKGA